MELREEFARLREEHEKNQYDIDLKSIGETAQYLREFVPMELFFKRIFDSEISEDIWGFSNYYYEKYRFNFQYADTNISVARHFRYDRHVMHVHDFFQINYCFSGEGSVLIGSEDKKRKPTELKLGRGDFNLIAPDTPHTVRAFRDDCVIIKYYIRRSTFEKTFFAWLSADDILSGFFRNAMWGGSGAYVNFRTAGDEEVERLALSIYMELMNHRTYYGILGESKLTELFCLLVRDHLKTAQTVTQRMRSDGGAGRIFAYLRESYQTATLDGAARELGYTKNYLCRVLRRTTGKTFCTLLNEIRVDAAKKLLLGGHENVAEVGRLVGYNSDEHFHRIFKSIAGKSPREWLTLARH